MTLECRSLQVATTCSLYALAIDLGLAEAAIHARAAPGAERDQNAPGGWLATAKVTASPLITRRLSPGLAGTALVVKDVFDGAQKVPVSDWVAESEGDARATHRPPAPDTAHHRSAAGKATLGELCEELAMTLFHTTGMLVPKRPRGSEEGSAHGSTHTSGGHSRASQALPSASATALPSAGGDGSPVRRRASATGGPEAARGSAANLDAAAPTAAAAPAQAAPVRQSLAMELAGGVGAPAAAAGGALKVHVGIPGHAPLLSAAGPQGAVAATPRRVSGPARHVLALPPQKSDGAALFAKFMKRATATGAGGFTPQRSLRGTDLPTGPHLNRPRVRATATGCGDDADPSPAHLAHARSTSPSKDRRGSADQLGSLAGQESAGAGAARDFMAWVEGPRHHAAAPSPPAGEAPAAHNFRHPHTSTVHVVQHQVGPATKRASPAAGAAAEELGWGKGYIDASGEELMEWLKREDIKPPRPVGRSKEC